MSARPFVPLLLWLMVLTSGLCYGAPLQLPVPSPIYLHLDQEDGLASNHVLSILQDDKGFLWFGTNNGLQRYDGRQFLHFRHDPRNQNSLASDIVETLYQDKQGVLWIASSTTITRFKPNTKEFTRMRLPEQARGGLSRGSYFTEDERGQIWLVSSANQPALLFKPDQSSFVVIAGVPTFRKQNSTYEPLLKNWQSNENYVYLKDSREIVWAGSEILLALYPDSSSFTLIPEVKASRYGIEYNRIFCLAEDRDKTIWIGTDNGVYYFNPDKQHFYRAPLPSFPHGDAVPLLPSDFLQTSSGEIWVSTLNRGILTYDSQLKPVRQLSLGNDAQAGSLQLWCLAQDQQGNIWAGSQAGTLLKIDTNGRSSYLRPDLLAGQTITKAAPDGSGKLWLGTDQGQLFSFDPATETLLKLNLGEATGSTGRIIRILAEQPHYVWVATSRGGMFKINKQTLALTERYHTSSSPFALLSNELGDMQWSDSSSLLISSIAGLHLLDIHQKTGKVFTTADGLPANAIINVVATGKGEFFVTPQNSLSRWNLNTGRLTTYGARDGLANDPYGFSASLRLRDGKILIGSMNGILYFHPDSLSSTQPPAEVLITGLSIYGKPVKLDSALSRNGEILLHHRQNFFTIDYASLNYYDDNRISYYYQLEGVDADWVAAGPNRSANYTNIESGNYRFKVKAEKDNGASTIHEASLAISIDQPFWQSWWFRSLLVLLVAGLGFILYRIRIGRLLALQNMRTQISRDLHDDMGSTLSTINILSAMVQQQIRKDPAQAQLQLEKISDYSQRMMESMDDIVWAINPLNDAAQNLVARMRVFCSEILEPKGISFTFSLDDRVSALRLPLAVKHNCFMIFKEAVNNAAKYAQCQSLEISLTIQKKQLHLLISDNGRGFDTNLPPEGNGLLNMQARARAIHGELEIISKKCSGTTISLKAPVGQQKV
ncbi:sensor histidine kinase [Cesiribacter sp. SM1]|uniref:sensor histidine kinase n=1 Tax=Cesiribacter sp. SM1 TaxID=2861196 RepID=UPI001CD7A8A2|nr:sensor histidine kinase [Cesiribacter sp. SM1]